MGTGLTQTLKSFKLSTLVSCQYKKAYGPLRSDARLSVAWGNTSKTTLCYTAGLDRRNPPEMRFKKFVKLTGYTCTCTNLTNYEYEAHAITRNGCYVNMLKLACKNSWNHNKRKLFSAHFSHLEPLFVIAYPIPLHLKNSRNHI